MDNKWCTTASEEIYNSLRAAETACSSDHNCIAIYDKSCDASDFRKCPKVANLLTSQGDCVYEKQGMCGQ